MREYYVTYKTAEGTLVETRVAAADHKSAAKPLVDAGNEIVEISRADEEDAYEGRRLGPLCLIVLLAVLAAAIAAVMLWLRK